jgi:hypothetical protein
MQLAGGDGRLEDKAQEKRSVRGALAVHGFRASRLAPEKRQQAAAVQGDLRSSIHDPRSSTQRGRAGAGCAAGFGLDHRDVVVVRRFRTHELAGEVAGELECETRTPLRCSLFGLQFPAMIKSFADPLTEN